MSGPPDASAAEAIHGRAVDAVVALLDSQRLMSVAVNRPDGWPQVTTVGYLNDGLNLYFVTARNSQKVANIQADPRVAVAIRAGSGWRGDAVGVSMAADAAEVTDPAAIERLNDQVIARYPEVNVYSPGEANVAVIRLRPRIVTSVSVIDGRSHAQSFSLAADGQVSRPAQAPWPDGV